MDHKALYIIYCANKYKGQIEDKLSYGYIYKIGQKVELLYVDVPNLIICHDLTSFLQKFHHIIIQMHGLCMHAHAHICFPLI